jgi:PKD repeat protein
MKNVLILIAVLCISMAGYTQNLVLNPSFESVTESNLQCSWYTTQAQFSSAIDNWTAPTGGSTDIFSLSLAQSCYCHPHSTHASAVGTQDPRTGDVMSHITVYGDGGCDPYREYLQGQLSTPLVVGTEYEVEFYVSFGDYCTDATNNFGVYFTTSPVDDPSMCVYDVTPQLNYTSVVTEETGWYQILFTFTPTQPYEYFMLGNFFYDFETSTVPMGGSKATVRYFVDDVRIEEADLIPTSYFTVTSPVCEGETSTITYTGNASSSATYHWDFDGGSATPGTGQGPHDVYWLNDGSYTVSLWVEENGEVSDTTTHTVTVNPIPTPYFSLSGLDCYGDDVTVTYTGSASSSATYNWDFDGATVLSGSGQGPYTIEWATTGSHTVTLDVEENGCASLPNTETLNNPTELTLSLSATDISCFGQNDGQISSTVNGGTPPYNYLWSDMSTSADVNGLSAATYGLTVTDDNGCTVDESATISEPTQVVLSTGGDQSICYGDSVNLNLSASGGTGTYVYYYNDGSGLQSDNSPDVYVSPLSDVTYDVYAEDANGCQSATSSISVQVSEPMNANTNLQHVTCNGACDGEAELNITGGIPPYDYSWSSATNTQTGICAGDYDITVTDDIGCTRSVLFTITEPDVLDVSLTASHVSCFGDSDGSISTTVTGGTPSYSYNWDNSDNTADLNDIAAGSYAVTVTDDNGCTASASIVINQPSDIQINTSDDLYLCAGDPANMSATASGGTGAYTYYWGNSDPYSAGTSNHTIYPYASQTYGVFAEDSNGCTSDTAFIEISLSSIMYIDLSVSDITCHSQCDGSAEINMSGGIPPYEYSWDSNGSTLAGLCEGFYDVSITDQNACVVDTFFNIVEPDTLMGTIYSKDPNCPGSADGVAWVNPAGGVPPYSFNWSDGQDTDSALFLSAGHHYVTITDDNGCQAVLDTYLEAPDDIIIYGLGNQSICIGNTASMSASITGGTAPYFYTWTGTDGYEWHGPQANVSPDVDQDYTLMITDANGCTESQTVTVSVYPPLEISSYYAQSDSICLGESTSLNFEVSGGNGGPYEVMFNQQNIVTSPVNHAPTYSGWHSIRVTDGCGTPAVEDSIYIEVLDLPANNFVSDIMGACPPAVVSFREIHENEENTYQWMFGDDAFAYGTNVSHLYENSGYYDVSLVVTDQYGCQKRNTKTEMIHMYPIPDIDFYTRPTDISVLNPKVEFYPVTANTDSLYWFFGDGDSTLSSRWNPVHTYQDVGNFEVMLVGVNAYTCRDTAYKVLKVKEQFAFYAPTAFSPNYDGYNDCFGVCGYGIDPFEFRLVVYDRWGEPVFETSRYDDANGCEGCGDNTWDGTMQGDVVKGDKLLPSGTYPWVCVYTDIFGVEHKEEGVVRLIR